MTQALPTADPSIQGSAQPAVAEQVFADYFGFDEDHEFVFPDNVSKIFFKALNEGDKAKYQREINRDVQLERSTGNARIKTDPAGERHALIEASVTDWNLRKNGTPITFSKGSKGSTFSQFLNGANPKLIEALEDAIRKANPWLIADMTVAQIDEEIERLQEQKATLIREEKEKEAFRG